MRADSRIATWCERIFTAAFVVIVFCIAAGIFPE
jgi:hypothetical protein